MRDIRGKIRSDGRSARHDVRVKRSPANAAARPAIITQKPGRLSRTSIVAANSPLAAQLKAQSSACRATGIQMIPDVINVR